MTPRRPRIARWDYDAREKLGGAAIRHAKLYIKPYDWSLHVQEVAPSFSTGFQPVTEKSSQ